MWRAAEYPDLPDADWHLESCVTMFHVEKFERKTLDQRHWWEFTYMMLHALFSFFVPLAGIAAAYLLILIAIYLKLREYGKGICEHSY